MKCDFRIRLLGRPQRDLLIEMYERFDPLGMALGLPPLRNDARREWIDVALSHPMNLGALSPLGAAVGHCFLAADKKDSAELAIFVRQEFRRRGVATALVKAMLDWGWTRGLRRIWALTGSENRIALRLLDRFGFRVTGPGSCGTEELEVQLPGGCFPPQFASDRSSVTRPLCAAVEPPRNIAAGVEGVVSSKSGSVLPVSYRTGQKRSCPIERLLLPVFLQPTRD